MQSSRFAPSVLVCTCLTQHRGRSNYWFGKIILQHMTSELHAQTQVMPDGSSEVVFGAG
jgi:hypothetical protein